MRMIKNILKQMPKKIIVNYYQNNCKNLKRFYFQNKFKQLRFINNSNEKTNFKILKEGNKFILWLMELNKYIFNKNENEYFIERHLSKSLLFSRFKPFLYKKEKRRK